MMIYNGIDVPEAIVTSLDAYRDKGFSQGRFDLANVWGSYSAALEDFITAYMQYRSIVIDKNLGCAVEDEASVFRESIIRFLTPYYWTRIFKSQIIKEGVSSLSVPFQITDSGAEALAKQYADSYKSATSVADKLSAYEMAKLYQHIAKAEQAQI